MSDQLSNPVAGLRTAEQEWFAWTLARLASQNKGAEEILASKHNCARAMPGADRQSVADLDALFELAAHPRTYTSHPGTYHAFPVNWIWYDEAKECRAAIRALPADRRASLFKYLLALKTYLGWNGALEIYHPHGCAVHGPEGDARRFEKLCEGIMMALCETGFPADAGLATRTLDWLAHHCPQGYDLTKVVGRDYARKALGAVKAIAQAAAKGMALPDAARRDALIVFDRYHGIGAESRDALLAKGNTLEPGARALLDISGYGRQDTFFQRMSVLVPARAGMWSQQYLDPAHWAFYLDFHRETRALIDDLKRAFAGSFAAPSWLSDPARFRATFDVSDDEMSWPWWICDPGERPLPEVRNQPGFAALRESERLQRIADPAFRSYTDDELEGFRRFSGAETNPAPFTFDCRGAPDIAAFTFEGTDPEGRFLDHLVSLDAAKPSVKWLKTTDDHVARLGADRVLGGFARWLGHLQDHSLDRVDWEYAGAAYMAFNTLAVLRNNFDRTPRERSRTHALRRLALRQLVQGGYCLGPNRWSSGGALARREAEHRLRRAMSEPSVAIARGVVWALSRIADQRVPALLEAAGREFYFKKFGDFRSKAAGNAVLWSLGQIGTLDAAYALARLRRAIRDKSVARLVDAALEGAGAKVGLGLDDMQDLATPDYGVGPDGTRSEMLGTHAVTLTVVSSRKATLTSLDTSDPKARRKRGVPKAAFADENTEALAEELVEAQTDIALLLPEARARLQSAWRRQRCWRLADWRERFLDNGLVATLSRRLIWRFDIEAGALDGIPRADGTILSADGEALPLPGPQTRVRLWHPLTERPAAVMAWRERLKASGIRQPFAQAWRANYVVTDAERETRTYSNRFAGHILHQPPLIAILRKRGWSAASRVAYDEKSDAKPNRLLLPAFGVAAEFWFSGVGTPSEPGEYGAPNYEYVTTDRLVFHALDAKNAVADAPLSLDQVPAMAFSEALCDLETAIDATSIAADRFWTDRGAGASLPVSELPGAGRYRDNFASADRGEAQALRKAFLETLLPSLAIAERCHIAGDWLMVDGTRTTYRIHLGSGASQLAESGRHLCIMPKGGEDELDFLPSEGNPTLSLILAKAMLLAEDDRIEDPTILSQLAV
jgi:uncharacterized protein DUF4132